MPDARPIVRSAPQTAGTIAQRAALSLEDIAQATGRTVPEVVLISTTVAKDTPLEELYLYIVQADALKLSPILRQCYWIKFDANRPGALHTGIDGYRLQASRSRCYAGSDDPIFRGEVEVLLGDGKTTMRAPESCTVTVWRSDAMRKHPFSATAFWTESYPGPGARGNVWRQRPRGLLAKTAEANALRKAFPAELAGLPSEAVDPEDVQVEPSRSPTSRMSVEQQAQEYERTIGQHERELPNGDVRRQKPSDMVTTPDDPLWQRWLLRAEEARALGLEVEDLSLPIGKTLMVSAGIKLNQAIAARKVERAKAQPAIVRSVDDPLYQQLADRIETAAGLGIDTTGYEVRTPAPASEFAAVIDSLEEAILAAENARDD